MRKYINRKSLLAFAALFIVAASLYYTNSLAERLAEEEKKKVVHLAEALKILNESNNPKETEFALRTTTENTTIPIIITGVNDVIADYKNIEASQVQDQKKLLKEKLAEFKKMHPPIVTEWATGKNKIYYGETYLLTQLRYFPYIQVAIVILFLAVVLFALTATYRSLQNQIWVGLSKETAHQLGTPLSSIEGWLELMREEDATNEAVIEMQKDLDRLKLVADRFSKVGSEPSLEEENLIARLKNMVAYMQKRSPAKVAITLRIAEEDVPVNISGPLFDWVIENLIRNALDSMEGVGSIELTVINQPQQVFIDVADSGKGIPRHEIKKIFMPGFTTKKRGWGLGLSLSRRIIEKYHHGSIFVKQSEVGKGTTFRIILRR